MHTDARQQAARIPREAFTWPHVETAGSAVYFTTIEQARFRKPVVPGQLLRMTVKKLRQRGPIWKFSGQAFVGEDLCAEAEFGAMISDGTQASSAG